MKINLLVCAIILASLSVVGCKESKPPMYSVSGTVTYEGKALPTGTVRFVSVGGGPGLPAAIGKDGSYQLKALAGSSRVEVIAVMTPTDQGDRSSNAEGQYGGDVAPQFLVPRKYARADTSGITVQVEAKEHNTIDIHVK